MPVRRSSTSFRQLLRGSSYFSRFPVKPSSPNRYSLSALTPHCGDMSPLDEACRSSTLLAASPMASRRAMYGSASSRGHSTRAMTSAAGASAVPGELDASTSSETRSFFTPLLLRFSMRYTESATTLARAQLVQRGQRQRSEPLHHELCVGELLGRVAARHADQPQAGAARRLETPARVLDGNRASRVEGASRALTQLLESQPVGRR